MTETTQQAVTTPDGLSIDASRQYKVIAHGQCPKCSYFKTWEFTIQNPITGKQIPGHVTKEGFKIGNGDCPYYSRLSKINARKTERKYQPSLVPAQNVVSVVNMANVQAVQSQQMINAPGLTSGKEIAITIGSIKIVLVMKDALQVAREILDQVMMRQ